MAVVHCDVTSALSLGVRILLDAVLMALSDLCGKSFQTKLKYTEIINRPVELSDDYPATLDDEL